MDWGSLEQSLHPDPAFSVEAPDQRKDWTELQRQTAFLRLMRMTAPRVLVFANANAGKRNPRKAKAEGITSGVFDLTAIWRGQVAYLEMKGFTKAGRAGQLSDNQIGFGNRLVELGIPCACFFSPYAAADWLRSLGFPVAEMRDAA
jgi:hypothetical protein